MGTNICKSQMIYEQCFTEQQIPKLNDKIMRNLRQKKPFQNQLKDTKNIVVRKYSFGVYQGPVNLFDNPSQYGKFYFNDGSLYIGQFHNGKAKGEGAMFYIDGSYMQGQINQKQISKGVFSCENYTYNGTFKQNLFHGKGQFRSKTHNYQFIGIFQNGKKKQGKLHWTSDKFIYTYYGSFNQNEQFQGQGQLEQQPLGFYKGTFKNGLKHGKGSYQYSNGLKYVGQYQEGVKSGKGIIYNGDDNSEAYSGQFKNDLPNGKGKALGQKNTYVEANWIQGINQKEFQI